jgi:hypothetical protein
VALSPRDVRIAVLSEHRDNLKEFEKSVDAGLVKGHRAFVPPSKVPCELIADLMNRYRANGWLVREVNDMRDGNYYHFTEK